MVGMVQSSSWSDVARPSGRRYNRLGAVTGGGVGEGFFHALEREARGDEPLDAELGHHGEGATVGRAATEGATDVELAGVDVPQVERQPAALGGHAYGRALSRGS